MKSPKRKLPRVQLFSELNQCNAKQYDDSNNNNFESINENQDILDTLLKLTPNVIAEFESHKQGEFLLNMFELEAQKKFP